MRSEPVVVKQTFAVSPAKVWDAISNRDQMVLWYFDAIATFDPVVGATSTFDIEHEGQVYHHVWTITEVDQHKRLVYDWQYEGIPGKGWVVWELAETGDGETELTLSSHGLETFPEDNPAFTRESAVAGWTYLINESLVDFLSA